MPSAHLFDLVDRNSHTLSHTGLSSSPVGLSYSSRRIASTFFNIFFDNPFDLNQIYNYRYINQNGVGTGM